MSLKGRQTGNTSGCCQNVFMRLSMCVHEYIYKMTRKRSGTQTENVLNI